jgi:hypothetical protein
MVPIGKDYYYHDGKIFKEIKPNCARSVPRYNLLGKDGKRRWITLDKIKQIIAKKSTR